MTSSVSGSYRLGGTLSSSNLSPLALPFKVDKPIPKPTSSNPSVNFSDMPLYVACFDPAPGQYWNSSSSSTSTSKFTATESLATNVNCSSSMNTFGYQEVQLSTSPASDFYTTTNVPAYDPFSYDPYPDRMPSNINDGTKSYYPQCIPPPPQRDGSLSLGVGVGSDSSYDLMSCPGSTHFNRCGSAQVNPPQNMPDYGGYKSKWGYVRGEWNGSEQGKWMDYDQGFISKELNASNLPSNKGSLFDQINKPFVDVNVRPFVDGSSKNHFFDDGRTNSHLKLGTGLTQDSGLYSESSTINAKDKCFDIFGGAYKQGSLGLERQGCMSSSECAIMRTSASASVSKGCPLFQEPVMESVSCFSFSQKENSSSQEDHFRHTGFSMFGGCRPSVEHIPSAVKLNSMGIDAADQSKSVTGHKSSYQMEAQTPLGWKRHSSITIRRPTPTTEATSLQIRETLDSRLDNKGSSGKIKFPSLVHLRTSLHGLNMEGKDAEAVHSGKEHFGGSDDHSSAEDSPCWKGSSSNHFSLIEHSENVDSDVLVKTIDKSRSLSSQGHQNNGLFPSRKLNKAISLEKPSVTGCTSINYDDFGSVNPKPYHFDLNTGGSPELSDDSHTSMMDCNLKKKSKSDLDPNSSPTAQTNPSGELSSASYISEALPSEKGGNDTRVVAEVLSGLTSNIDSKFSNLLPGNKTSLKSAGGDSDSKIDVNMLLRTMMSLSEIFRSHCFRSQAKVAEKHTVCIKQIISNLTSSMLLMSGATTPTPLLSSFDKVLQKEFPVVEMVNDAEMLATSLKLGGRTEDLSDYVFFKDDEFPFGDVNMTEALKNLVSENLQEEETDQQKLLYKNLWLEAEASLCVMTAKARFLRVKTEMKRIHDGTKDTDSLARPNVPDDVKLATIEEDSPSLGECPKPSTSGEHTHIKVFHDPKPELNIGARYQILKNRIDTSGAMNYESKEPCNGHNCPLSLFEIGNGSLASVSSIKANAQPTTVFGGYQILKGKDDNSDHLNYELPQSPGDENYLPDDNSSSRDKVLQDSQMSKSSGVTDDDEASVMARYRIIQSRMDHSNTMTNNPTSGQTTDFPDSRLFNSLGVTNERMATFRSIRSCMDHSNSMTNDPIPGQSSGTAEDEIKDIRGRQQKSNIKETAFGLYPELLEDENVYGVNIGVDERTDVPIMKANRMGTVVFEGWYDNESSSSDWEHISSPDV
ncbi:unnamed protein product [Amaranthus hypochondriacus]